MIAWLNGRGGSGAGGWFIAALPLAAVAVAAGALVPPGKHLPTRTLWAGNPARQVRALSPEQAARLRYGAEHYVRIKDEYLAM